MAVLTADGDRAADGDVRGLGQELEGRADEDVYSRLGMGGGDLFQLGQGRAGSVHLPVAGGQLAHHPSALSFSFFLDREGLGCNPHMPSNLIDSPQPQASVTLGLLKTKPDSRSEVW